MSQQQTQVYFAPYARASSEVNTSKKVARGRFFSQSSSWAVPDPEPCSDPCPVVLIKVKVHPYLDLNFTGSWQKKRAQVSADLHVSLHFKTHPPNCNIIAVLKNGPCLDNLATLGTKIFFFFFSSSLFKASTRATGCVHLFPQDNTSLSFQLRRQGG
jgi:hypothetical protein